MPQPFTGLIAYPITPLTNDGELELGSLTRLVRGAAAAGVAAVSVLATSGAGVTFNRAERHAVAEAAVAAVMAETKQGTAPIHVYAAVSAASTREVVCLAKDAQRAGVSGLLLAPFSYLPLSDIEVRALFEAVADATDLPLCFYNKPAQTHYDISAMALDHLTRSAHVVAVKETMRRDNIAARLRELRDAVGPDVSLGLSSDAHLLDQLPQSDAWHTGLAALLPGLYVQVWRAACSGLEQGEALSKLRGLAKVLSEWPHAVGTLHGLAQTLGVRTAAPRGPFAPARPQDIAALKSTFELDVPRVL